MKVFDRVHTVLWMTILTYYVVVLTIGGGGAKRTLCFQGDTADRHVVTFSLNAGLLSFARCRRALITRRNDITAQERPKYKKQ